MMRMWWGNPPGCHGLCAHGRESPEVFMGENHESQWDIFQHAVCTSTRGGFPDGNGGRIFHGTDYGNGG